MGTVDLKKTETTETECKFAVGDKVRTEGIKSAEVLQVKGGKKIEYLIGYTEKAKRKQRIDDKLVTSEYDKPERAWVLEKDLEKIK
jgi:hypothetical protein